MASLDEPEGELFDESLWQEPEHQEHTTEPWTEPPSEGPPAESSQCVALEKEAAKQLADEGLTNTPPLPVVCTPVAVSKRRRLFKKTAVAVGGSSSSSPASTTVSEMLDSRSEPNDSPSDKGSVSKLLPATTDGDGGRFTVVFPLKQHWVSWAPRRQYLWIFERVRGYWTTLPSVKKKFGGMANYRDCRKMFTVLTKTEKTDVAMDFVRKFKAPDYVQQLVTATFGWKDKDSKLFGKTLLLTYSGPWGLKDESGSQDFDVSALTLEQVVGKLQQDPATLTHWQDMKDFAQDTMETLLCSDVSVCLEVCTATLAKEMKARCHMRIWLRCCRRIWVSDATKLVFQGQGPNMSGVMGGVVRDTRAASFQGMLYTSSLKLGSVFSHATREPFTGYLVQPSWLMNLLQSQKISFDTCREAVLSTCQNVGRYLKDLDQVEQHFRQKEIEAEVQRAQRVLAGRRRPFCNLPEVVEWRKQYDEDNFRFRFLVLEGPSRFGKTQFVRSLVPEDQVLELSCSGGTPIDLKSFLRHKHKLVLFDEVEAPQVLALRKAFQAGPSPVQLGQSQTGMYTYWVFLYRVMFVLCSNTWTESLSKLKQGDANWIEQNQIHVAVDKQLYT